MLRRTNNAMDRTAAFELVRPVVLHGAIPLAVQTCVAPWRVQSGTAFSDRFALSNYQSQVILWQRGGLPERPAF